MVKLLVFHERLHFILILIFVWFVQREKKKKKILF